MRSVLMIRSESIFTIFQPYIACECDIKLTYLHMQNFLNGFIIFRFNLFRFLFIIQLKFLESQNSRSFFYSGIQMLIIFKGFFNTNVTMWFYRIQFLILVDSPHMLKTPPIFIAMFVYSSHLIFWSCKLRLNCT